MIFTRSVIENAISTACQAIDSPGAAFAIGSFAEYKNEIEEFDFVVVLPEASRQKFSDFASYFGKEFVNNSAVVAIQLASHFVPRSYSHRLTLHGAFYTDSELLNRRPRLLAALNDETRIWGDQIFVPKVVASPIHYLDLVFGRWGLIHALNILKQGACSVPMWNLQANPPVIQPITFHLTDPCVLIEYVWYFASKLTSNLLEDLYAARSACSSAMMEKQLENLRPLVISARNQILVDDQSKVMICWENWATAFQSLVEAAIAEDRNKLHALSLCNSISSVDRSSAAPRNFDTKLNPQQVRYNSE